MCGFGFILALHGHECYIDSFFWPLLVAAGAAPSPADSITVTKRLYDLWKVNIRTTTVSGVTMWRFRFQVSVSFLKCLSCPFSDPHILFLFLSPLLIASLIGHTCLFLNFPQAASLCLFVLCMCVHGAGPLIFFPFVFALVFGFLICLDCFSFWHFCFDPRLPSLTFL